MKPRPSTTLACLTIALAMGALPLQADPVDDQIALELKKRHLPGITVAIGHQGKLVKTAAAGFADLEHQAPATPRTIFQIQSITKTFTAAAILRFVEQGKLTLDDPVSKHLDGTPDSWKAITLRHLLNHTSGIKDFINEPTASLRLDVTEEDVLKATAGRPLNFPPGERYAYSNTNYHLLAMILRKLTGKFYGDALREQIFQPLELHQTRVFTHADILPGRAAGYRWNGTAFLRGEFVAEPILAYGGGGILSTATDLANWGLALLDGRFLKPPTLALAWTAGTLNNGSHTSYGLGWGVNEVAGHREISHTGGHVTGFSTCLSIYPDDNLVVVVLINQQGANPGVIARKLAGLYVPVLTPKPPPPIADNEPETARRLRELIARVPNWELTESEFTPELWKVLLSQRESLQSQARAMGSLRSLDLLARRRNQDLRTSRFRAVFENHTLNLTLTLNDQQIITGLDSDEED